MKPSHTLITSLIDYQAGAYPEKNAFVFLADDEKQYSITFEELQIKAKKVAAAIQHLSGIRANDNALLMFQPGLNYITMLLGCIYAGVVPVPVYPPNTRNITRIKHIVEETSSKLIFAERSLHNNYTKLANDEKLTQWEQNLLADKHWLFEDVGQMNTSADYRQIDFHPDQTAFLQYTSGSTSAPKGVQVSHYNILHNAELCHKYFGHTPACTMVSWLPPYHDMGLIGGIFQPLYIGMTGVVMSPISFLKRPVRWLKAISDIKPEGNGFVCSGAPNFAYDFCVSKITAEDRDTLDLRHWEIAYSGSEPVKGSTLRNFSDFFQKSNFNPKAFYPVYGLAEATLLVTAGVPLHGHLSKYFNLAALNDGKVMECSMEEGIEIVGCGNILPEQCVLLIDHLTMQPVPKDSIGEILIAGDSVTQGYYNKESLSREVFNTKIDGYSEKGFLRTGDLGFVYNGQLFIQGRLKDLIIIRGRNYYPQDIEFAIAEISNDLRENTCAAFSIEVDAQESLVVVQELKRTAKNKVNLEAITNSIVNKISKEFNLRPYDVILIEPSTIPKTTSGKIQRNKVKELFKGEQLRQVYSWRLAEINK
jgi:acyl-CoA synthetase (AMP-forming)/AMP-acid ligase II